MIVTMLIKHWNVTIKAESVNKHAKIQIIVSTQH